MINVAIVEDNPDDQKVLISCLNRYTAENETLFSVKAFDNGFDFINKYQAVYDIIFLDIEMPLIDGMSVARRLREIDQTTILMFVTNLTQYAIKGYEVDAMDYILKPLKYPQFSLKIRKAVARCRAKAETSIRISTKTGDIVFPQSSLLYVESSGHQITYHTESGNYVGYGTMKEVEEKLPKAQFFRCNSGIIVNLGFAAGYDGSMVTVREEQLPVSRARRKEFMSALQEYYMKRGHI